MLGPDTPGNTTAYATNEAKKRKKEKNARQQLTATLADWLQQISRELQRHSFRGSGMKRNQPTIPMRPSGDEFIARAQYVSADIPGGNVGNRKRPKRAGGRMEKGF